MEAERVQKIIAQAGLASRREAEALIRQGLVTINGKVCQLGDKAVAGKDHIKVRGKLIQVAATPVYLALHKPKGVIAMAAPDPEGRPTLLNLLGDQVRERVFPVGRMDYNGEGLMILTNDGAFAARLGKSKDIVRAYVVKVSRHPDDRAVRTLEKGFSEEGRTTIPTSVRVTERLAKNAKVELVFTGLGAVDVRELCQRAGLLVERVVLDRIGHLSLQDLPPGAVKRLKASQIEALVEQPSLGVRDLAAAKEKDYRKEKKRAARAAITARRRGATAAKRGSTSGRTPVIRPRGEDSGRPGRQKPRPARSR